MAQPAEPLALRGMILDVDGTLVLSNEAHARAWCDALREFGFEIPYERVRHLIGMGADQLLPRLVPTLSAESEPGKTIAALRRQIFLQRYVSQLRAAPGARELVSQLRACGLQLIVGSSASQDELDQLLAIAGAQDLLPDHTTADDVARSKPAPDIIVAALQRLGLSAHYVALLGDTPYDKESAEKASLPFIALRCGGFSMEELAGAAAICDDPADLLAHLSVVIRVVPMPTTDAARQGQSALHGDEETII